MMSDHERYDAISAVRSQFWRRYLTAVVVPIITFMLVGRNWVLTWIFLGVAAVVIAYTRYLLYGLAAAAGFSHRERLGWIAASFVLTGFGVALLVLEAPLRRIQQRIADRALSACPECGAAVWEGQEDCLRCGVPVPGTGRPYYDS